MIGVCLSSRGKYNPGQRQNYIFYRFMTFSAFSACPVKFFVEKERSSFNWGELCGEFLRKKKTP